jgi:hypothetical protein
MTNKSQLLDHIQAMEGHDVKALVLEWLTGTEGRLEDLEQMLDGEEDFQEQVLYAQFLAKDAEENPEKLVPFTSDMLAKAKSLLKDVTLDEIEA